MIKQTTSLLAAALPKIMSTPMNLNISDSVGSRQESQRPGGPPTPTHSESTDLQAPPMHFENALPRKSKYTTKSVVIVVYHLFVLLVLSFIFV